MTSMPSGPCAYCSHAPAHHRDGGEKCSECVKDRNGHECRLWIKNPTRASIEAALRRSSDSCKGGGK